MTKRKLAAAICHIEGKKSQVAMGNMMETLTAIENYFAAMRVYENPDHVDIALCKAESEMIKRVIKIAAKAKKKMVKSPMGEALIKLPAMVAMLRMGVEETSLVNLAKSGKYCNMVGDSIRSVTVADAPKYRLFPTFSTPFK